MKNRTGVLAVAFLLAGCALLSLFLFGGREAAWRAWYLPGALACTCTANLLLALRNRRKCSDEKHDEQK